MERKIRVFGKQVIESCVTIAQFEFAAMLAKERGVVHVARCVIVRVWK